MPSPASQSFPAGERLQSMESLPNRLVYQRHFEEFLSNICFENQNIIGLTPPGQSRSRGGFQIENPIAAGVHKSYRELHQRPSLCLLLATQNARCRIVEVLRINSR